MWARNKISLLDFLRKTTNEGKICHWLKKLYCQSGSADSLADFAAEYKMAGEKVVAADTCSRRSDKFYGQWLVLHKPFSRLADFVDEEKLKLVPTEMKYIAMAVLAGYGEDTKAIEDELIVEGRGTATTKELLGMVCAQRGQILDYFEGRLVRGQETDDEEDQQDSQQQPKKKLKFNRQQLRFKGFLDAHVERALAHRHATGEQEVQNADKLRKEALDPKQNQVLVCFGPAGSGKTTVVHRKIEQLLEAGGSVAFGLPTAQLASRMRERYAHITRRLHKTGIGSLRIDTCHALFGLGQEVLETGMPLLSSYDLVVVDEVSQLSGDYTDHIIKLWELSDRIPGLAMIGDRWQMAGVGEIRPWHTVIWKRSTFKTNFLKTFRCKDPAFQKLLNKLRVGKPNKQMLKQMKKKKAWNPPGPPTALGVQRLLHAHPNTEILALTRRGACEVNNCALEAFYPFGKPLIVLPGDMESNPDNYEKDTGDGSKLKPAKDLEPLGIPIYKNMQVYFTKNVRKDMDFVNGMKATVLGYSAETKALRVLTRTGHTIDVWRWTDANHGNLSYYPLRPGYCSTILKFQGAELDHVTVYLDTAKAVPAAAYTGLSRVSYGDKFLIASRLPLTRDHFTPARGA